MQSLWEWLPDRVRLMQPRLLFTSSEHGTNLLTLYGRCETSEPTVLLVKVSGSGEVLGAYCSLMWKERSRPGQKGVCYFGTGESFVFTLHPQSKCFKWVGCSHPSLQPTQTSANSQTTADSLNTANAQNTANAPSISQLPHVFQAGDANSLLVGDGPALQFTSDLQRCSSRSCATFGSPQLSASTDFEVAALEVLGFD